VVSLSEIVARGWRGFKAEWVKDKQENKLLTFAERDEMLKRQKWEEMTGRKWPEPGNPQEVATVMNLQIIDALWNKMLVTYGSRVDSEV
jgi:hypothetical protein